MATCWIGIGANLGDARVAFDAVLQHLHHQRNCDLGRRSSLYLTRPIGQHAGNTFSNAVLELQTSLEPLGLLDLLQSIENTLGRERTIRWGPRPIDLDLLFYDQVILGHPHLTLPHPSAWYRRFVLDPLAEVVPDLCHPLLNETIAQLKARAATRPLVISCRTALNIASLQAQFPGVRFGADESTARSATYSVLLNPHEPYRGRTPHGTPVADLTRTPGSPEQRVCDFLSSILDEPVRDADW
jgi:2-amino-4-hydroxy-6-hydroxymethyldihydropteridine diphosphokinase